MLLSFLLVLHDLGAKPSHFFLFQALGRCFFSPLHHVCRSRRLDASSKGFAHSEHGDEPSPMPTLPGAWAPESSSEFFPHFERSPVLHPLCPL